MTIVELVKDLIDSGKERIKTPISSTYFMFFAIYNWRPISIFIFSDKPIEERICWINSNYCNIDAVFNPLLYAIGYILLIPLVSAALEKLLYWPTSIRRYNKNREKKDIIRNELALVADQLKLQDARSRNREKEDLLNKISDLENKILTDRAANDAIASDYDKQVRDLTKRLNDTIVSENTFIATHDEDFNKILDDYPLDKSEIGNLMALAFRMDDSYDPKSFSSDTLNFMFRHGFLRYFKERLELTKLGKDFIAYLLFRGQDKNL